MEMRHSDRCEDLTTRLDKNTQRCVQCTKKPGYEVTPNCGYDDHGGQHEPPNRKCRDNTFNDGSRAHCLPCTPCPPGYFIIGSCNSTTDTQCRETRSQTTPVTVSRESELVRSALQDASSAFTSPLRNQHLSMMSIFAAMQQRQHIMQHLQACQQSLMTMQMLVLYNGKCQSS